MKLFISLFCLLLVSQAYAKNNQVLRCTTKVLESKQLDSQSINEALDILKKLDTVPEKELKERCEKLKTYSETLPKLEDAQIKEMISDLALSTENDYRKYYLVQKIILSAYHCRIVGAEVDLILGVGGGFGANVGYCQSAGGKRYAVVAPEFILGVGAGVFALFDYVEFDIYPGEVVHVNSDGLDFVFGIIYAGSTNLKGDDTNNGFGVGLGLGLKFSSTMPLRLIPMGRNFKDLKKQILY
jgi:hypothetical protein